MRIRLALLLAPVACLLACERGGPAAEVTLEQVLAADWSGLACDVVTSMPEGRPGGAAVVLLHGYGRTGSDYAELAHALAGDETRVFLPTAVLPHAEGAMWWEFLEDDWPRPVSDDPSAGARPEPSRQLPLARRAVLGLVERIRRQYRPQTLAVAGHSQGGMLALDVALTPGAPVDRVAVLGGYLLLDSLAALPEARASRPAIFVSHGRADPLIAFEAAVRMRRLLGERGYQVRLVPHDGEHEVAASVVPALRSFLVGGASGAPRNP